MSDELRLLHPGQVAELLDKSREVAKRLMSTQQIKSRNLAGPGERDQWVTTLRHVQAFIDGFGGPASSGVTGLPDSPTGRPSNVIELTYRERKKQQRMAAGGR